MNTLNTYLYAGNSISIQPMGPMGTITVLMTFYYVAPSYKKWKTKLLASLDTWFRSYDLLKSVKINIPQLQVQYSTTYLKIEKIQKNSKQTDLICSF